MEETFDENSENKKETKTIMTNQTTISKNS
jgi:hypothetical protein